jgi:hypothetical protein
MAKYILIEFDDDATADALCAQINTATAKGKKFRLVGIFAKPPKARCTCGPLNTERIKRGKIRRHKKLGFFYCTDCKKVRSGPQGPKNQLDPRAPNRFAPTLSLSGDGLPVANYPVMEAY